MSLDPGVLLVSLMVSTVGAALFIYGKKQSRLPHLAAGVLMTLSVFAPGAILPLVISALVAGALIWAVRLGL